MTIYGTDGNDLILPHDGETVYGLGGDDNIQAQDYFEAYEFHGGDGNDILVGAAADDILDGGPGADHMNGFAGSDTFFVDDPGDVVEITDPDNYGSMDTVVATISYSLGYGLSNLTLLGTAEIDGTGNGRDNILVGNGAHNHLDGLGGSDFLDGGLGADTMTGGPGDDGYWVDNRGDVVVERAGKGEGIDEVGTTVSYALSANVENLFLFGSANISGSGNGLDNFLGGNRGDNALRGQAGNDLLAGGSGRDTLWGGGGDDLLYGYTGKDKLSGGAGHDGFEFDTPRQGADSIADFHHQGASEDAIIIWAKGFGAGLRRGHWLGEAQFESGSTNQAQDGDTRFIFRTTDETLWFDTNGGGRGGLRLVADLQDGAQVTADDIWLG